MGKRATSLHSKQKSRHSKKTKKRLATKEAMLAARVAKKKAPKKK